MTRIFASIGLCLVNNVLLNVKSAMIRIRKIVKKYKSGFTSVLSFIERLI